MSAEEEVITGEGCAGTDRALYRKGESVASRSRNSYALREKFLYHRIELFSND